ncbi:hypothetical protein PISL3812_03698 [Talaromyces islandicus]|uniref:Rhodopsin domain-containing protein n=1 Tax=Talaromyces islandicus TaxID=28573 RepID=A0A0U1LTG5_TALIS|nr:hypothetical protein PISL3812_03698 [Talaromyces islandicus]
MSTAIASSLEARDAVSDTQRATVELWTLYAIGVAVTILRTFARVRSVGLGNLRLDDCLVWVAIIFYTAQTALAYNVGNVAHGLANNSMTTVQRAALSPESPEYNARVIGSKIQVAGWTTYTALINSLKLSMLAFYVRLTEGLGRRHQIPIYIGWFLVIGSFLASVITIFAACRPFHKNWQINPNPGRVCQPAISKPVIAATFAGNLVTDPYLIFIPVPILWQSSLKLLKKIAATIILGAGVFVLVCATLKSVFLLADPDDGAQLADEWGTRETFVAVITTNLPMIFHLIRVWLSKVFGSRFQSSQKTSKSPLDGFRGGSYYTNRKGRSPANTNPITINMTFTESEERMMEDVRMQNLKSSPASASESPASNAIMVSNQIEVTHETRSSQHSQNSTQDVHDVW